MLKKVAMGMIAFWPIIYSSFFAIYSLRLISSTSDMAGQGLLPLELLSSVWFYVFGIVSIFTALAVYIANVFKNNKVKKDLKALWVIILPLGNLIAMPIYWYLYIWRNGKQK